MKNIVITGGAGFIGSNLAKKLSTKNKVWVIDNFSTGSKTNLYGLKNIMCVSHDIIDPIPEQLFEDFTPDEIYHLACPASPPQYQKDPLHTIKTSVIGTMNILNVAVRFNSKFLFTSTSEIYGDPLIHPQVESYWGNVNPVGVRSCYDEGKRIAETIVTEYRRKYGIDTKIVRIFNTYGPNLNKDDGRVVSNFIMQALLNKPITIYGDGKQTRSLCYVSDLVDGLIKMLHDSVSTSIPINLGNPNEQTILEIGKKIIKLTNSKSKIVFKDLPEDDPHRRKPDISMAKAYLKWQPKVSLDEGLKSTIKYFKQKYL